MGMGHMHAFITTVEMWHEINLMIQIFEQLCISRLVAQNSQYAASSQSSQNSQKIEK